MATIFSAIATILWSALGRVGMERLNDIGVLFFLTVATCWAVIIPAKFWGQRRGDSWMRRVIMMGVGLCVGLCALWLDGWIPNLPTSEIPPNNHATAIVPASFSIENGLPNVFGYLSYFALAFFALRWWKLADRRRAHRFSFAPVLAAGFWGVALLLVWQDPWRGTLVLTTAAGIIQLVSPWDQPPPPVARRMRLRYA